MRANSIDIDLQDSMPWMQDHENDQKENITWILADAAEWLSEKLNLKCFNGSCATVVTSTRPRPNVRISNTNETDANKAGLRSL